MPDSIKCPQCGKILASEVEAMPVCSLRYRLLGGNLCYGHRAEVVRDA
jgi:hypothetical protein